MLVARLSGWWRLLGVVNWWEELSLSLGPPLVWALRMVLFFGVFCKFGAIDCVCCLGEGALGVVVDGVYGLWDLSTSISRNSCLVTFGGGVSGSTVVADGRFPFWAARKAASSDA